MRKLTEEEKQKLKEKLQEASAHRKDIILEKDAEMASDLRAEGWRQLTPFTTD